MSYDEGEEILHFEPGATIIEEGQRSDKMYVVQKGSVRISKIVLGSNLELAVLTQGEFFGEMGILNSRPRTATAVAVDSVTVLALDWSNFADRITDYSAVALHMIRTLARRLDETLAIVERLQTPSKLSIMYALTDELDLLGAYEECDISLNLTLDIKKLEAKTNQSIEAIESSIRKLEELSLLSPRGQVLYIPSTQSIWQYLRNIEGIEDFGEQAETEKNEGS